MRVLLLALLLLAPGVAVANASPGPAPPCEASVSAGIPQAGSSPRVRLWLAEDLGNDWTPPDCLGWEKQEFSLLLEVEGRFLHDTGSAGVVERLAAVSRFREIQYWSVTRDVWRPFINDAYALGGPDPENRRADFSAGELVSGAVSYFWQDDNSPIGAAVYRLVVRERRADKLVVVIENVSPVSFLMVPILNPGEHQFFYLFEQDSPSEWRYYSLMRTSGSTSSLIGDFKASYINRAVAIYRYLTGQRTDMEPPAAP